MGGTEFIFECRFAFLTMATPSGEIASERSFVARKRNKRRRRHAGRLSISMEVASARALPLRRSRRSP